MKDISVKNLNRVYGDIIALEDFSASFEYGRCTAIMGTSGCGKTTLLNIMMGLDREYTGTVEGMPERFGAVFQEDRLCRQFSVMDNLRMVIVGSHGRKNASDTAGPGHDKASAQATGDVDIDADIVALLTELGLAEHVHCKVSELSGGQKRRVAIARALIYGTELIIMDEPFKGLDQETRKMAAEAVKRRAGTVIMVTHDPEEVELMEAELLNMKMAGTQG